MMNGTTRRSPVPRFRPLAWSGAAALLLLLAACRSGSPSPAGPPNPTRTAPPAAPIVTVAIPAEPGETRPPPTATAARPAQPSTPAPTATAHPMAAYTIAGLRQAVFPGGPISLSPLADEGDGLARYAMRYPSPGPAGSGAPEVSGLLYLPAGTGPFPVVILLHGYYDRDQYWSGAGTWQAAEFLAGRGYLAVIPDYRGWGGSDSDLSLFHSGLVADVLNLLSALASLPQADPARVGLWGHSMGGGIATKVLAVDGRVGAAVLYAPNSADDADLIARWGPGCRPEQSLASGGCNPAEIIPTGTPGDLVDAYLAAAADPALLRQIAPIYHLEAVTAPVQIHIGTADGQALSSTPPEWSEKLYLALQAAGKDAGLFTYEGQGHFFAEPDWSLFMERAAAFFDGHLRQP